MFEKNFQTFMLFVWKYRRYRPQHQTLRWTKLDEGLTFPDVQLYYQACHLAMNIDWSLHVGLKQSVDLEHHVSPIYLPGLPWCANEVPNWLVLHPTIGATWATCQATFPLKEISPSPSPLYAIIGNPLFSDSLGHRIFCSVMTGMGFRASSFV